MDSNFVHSLIRRDLYELLHQITVPQTAGNYVVNIPLLLLLSIPSGDLKLAPTSGVAIPTPGAPVVDIIEVIDSSRLGLVIAIV